MSNGNLLTSGLAYRLVEGSSESSLSEDQTVIVELGVLGRVRQGKMRALGWVELLRYDERILTGGGHTLKHWLMRSGSLEEEQRLVLS